MVIFGMQRFLILLSQPELQAALASRSLVKTGTKAQLAERLWGALKAERSALGFVTDEDVPIGVSSCLERIAHFVVANVAIAGLRPGMVEEAVEKRQGFELDVVEDVEVAASLSAAHAATEQLVVDDDNVHTEEDVAVPVGSLELDDPEEADGVCAFV